MTLILFLLFLGVPLIEIALFIQIGGALGVAPTLGLVVLTAVVGTALVRAQGLKTWRQAEHSLQRGEMPVNELFDGLCIFLAGAFLLTPGFFTDAVGLLLLFPPVRALLRDRLRHHIVVTRSGDRRERHSVIIEGDYTEIDPDRNPDRDPDRHDGPGGGPPRPPLH